MLSQGTAQSFRHTNTLGLAQFSTDSIGGDSIYPLRHYRQAYRHWKCFHYRLGGDITGEGFDGVQLDKLEYLSLEQSAIQDIYLKFLANFENLNVISLIRTDISDIYGLQKLKKLRILNLSACPVSDEGLRAVGELSSLEQLSLLNTNVSDKGIKYLTSLKQLITQHFFCKFSFCLN